MNATAVHQEATSIEELTVQSLDMSAVGVEALKQASLSCGDSLLSHDERSAPQFIQFIRDLTSFYVFENDICSLFQINKETIGDAKGHLEAVETRLTDAINDMVERFSNDERATLADMLRIDVPSILTRFSDLLPILREYVQREYLTTAN